MTDLISPKLRRAFDEVRRRGIQPGQYTGLNRYRYMRGEPLVMPNTTRSVRTEKRVRMEFTAEEVLFALRAAGHNIPFQGPSPRCFIRVPGGGDWSNTDLDLDNQDTPLIVTFETVEQS
jgi:hypothetical protein